MRKFQGCLTGAALLAAGAALAPAAAQDTVDGLSLSANVAFTSDYRFRGVSFSEGDFAIQGGFDASLDSGFYLGTWASSIEGYGSNIDVGIDGLPVFESGSETELDLYGGYAFGTEAVAFDVGVIGYFYPGSDNTEYWEVYGSASGSIGAGSVTGGIAWVPDQDNAGGDNLYVYTDAGFGLGESGLSLDLHLGYTDGAFVYSGDDQLDWSAGVSLSAIGLDFSAAYVATDADTDFDDMGLDPVVADDLEDAAEDLYGGTVVFTVGKSF
ncbi:TorF family putative porin [Parvularcula oceani]|uniref:TorF family putative porin n=1 Tax=Parvularcula oceani TaxID=1247963 RepID=UPI00068C488F|nr:TorF family putative porin [Parvularcula oceani]